MAKKKKRKDENGKKFEHAPELWGIACIILAILAFGAGRPLGIVGKLMRAFAVFLFGTLDGVFLLVLFILGWYLLIKRKAPSIWSTKVIGLVILTIGILVFSHLVYIEKNDGSATLIFQATMDDTMQIFNQILNGIPFKTNGSGIMGCALAVLFNILFDSTGTKIVSIILIVMGACFFTGFSIFEFIRKGYEKGKNILPNINKQREIEKQEAESAVIINDSNAPVDNKVVISNIEELKHMNHSPEVTETPVKEDIETSPSNYVLPPVSLLNNPPKKVNNNQQTTIENNIIVLEKTLREFGIIGKVVEVNSGPSVTQYELELQTGTKLTKLLSINREISLALAKRDVRIQAPIPGKSTVGIEVANDVISMVTMREIIETVPENKKGNKLLAVLGKNILGQTKFCEIDKTPHLLVAGATGSGKSVCINCIITSILMRAKPDEVKLMMVDPKKVELSVYNGIPHLLMPVVTDPKKANIALQKIVSEMENRYELLSEKNVKNISSYNEWVEKENKSRPDGEKIKKMHYIVVIVDELADLMVVASKEVEDSIMRIAQMARAAGIHMILATQRPSTDVITGVVKANIPSRIAFTVSSSIDSRTILDQMGAEKLLGKGDMLFAPMGEIAPERIQGAYVTDDEIQKIVDYTVAQQIAQYDEKFMNLASAKDQGNAGGEVGMTEEEYDDPLYDEIVEFVITTGKASASLLQRRFKLGYNRAARIIDLLEERGIIGPQNGSKPRDVLMKLKDDNEE